MWKLIMGLIVCIPLVFLGQLNSDKNQPKWGECPASGMLLGSKDMLLYVVFVYGNSKAESAGIKSGDYIVQIQNDSEAMFIEPVYAVNMINAYPVGTEIRLAVQREDARLVFKLVWEDITEPDILLPAKQNSKWGYIDINGNLFIPAIFDTAAMFSDGLALVKIDNQHKFINKMGQTEFVNNPDYKLYRFYNGRALFEINGKYGFVDITGNEVIPAEYDFAQDFSQGLALAEQDQKWGYINKYGETAIPFQFSSGYYFSEELAAVRDSQLKFGFIDTTGNLVIPYQFDDAAGFQEGFALVEKNNKQYFINKKGETAITPQDKVVVSFSLGLAIVMKDNKFGFIDTTGKVVIPFQYDFAQGFFEGLSAVELNKKYGYIDKQGIMHIAPQFESANNFHYGLARVAKNGLMMYIDKNGKTVWQESK